ncbi:2-amino-4-hydroxy-6-hydroxymethyldihydropteridinepyrophosphokinase [hydrothermal vent metagenome]|uniref:2-amino-4-hydroxy-6-hydroxymethyldihydropteridine diphosphokinase n=1 Tax=hydrothermal vent metagenome TaxID=652676 RepID=A0A3B0WDV4_9ZZZZ
MVLCYISLGSNLNQPLQQLNLAKQSVAELPKTTLNQISSIYQSIALTLDDEPQNDYFNAVIQVNTALKAEQLLDELQRIELNQGRIRDKRWGARTIDLDILLYGNQIISTARLIIPHQEIENRNFVLYPLNQIAPSLKIPGKKTLSVLLENIDDSGLKKIGEFC